MTEKDREMAQWLEELNPVSEGLETKKVDSKFDLRIDRVQIQDPEYISEVPERMRNKLFPGFPSTTIIIGKPGSGKTNLLIYMLLSPKFWNGFFDSIYLFGPTTESDKLYACIELDEEKKISEDDKIIPRLKEIQEEQREKVKSNPADAPKMLNIFEDFTSQYSTVQNKPPFIKSYCQIRHFKGSSVALAHKYKAINRTVRLCSQHVITFKCNKTEIDQLYEDFPPTDLNSEQFYMMVKYALTPTKDCPKPFFYVNTMVPEEKMYRRCFEFYLTPSTRSNPLNDRQFLTNKKRKKQSNKKQTKKNESCCNHVCNRNKK